MCTSGANCSRALRLRKPQQQAGRQRDGRDSALPPNSATHSFIPVASRPERTTIPWDFHGLTTYLAVPPRAEAVSTGSVVLARILLLLRSLAPPASASRRTCGRNRKAPQEQSTAAVRSCRGLKEAGLPAPMDASPPAAAAAPATAAAASPTPCNQAARLTLSAAAAAAGVLIERSASLVLLIRPNLCRAHAQLASSGSSSNRSTFAAVLSKSSSSSASSSSGGVLLSLPPPAPAPPPHHHRRSSSSSSSAHYQFIHRSIPTSNAPDAAAAGALLETRPEPWNHHLGRALQQV